MKFNCGKSPEQKYKDLQRWHRWFAWRPVRVASYDCRWLEWVERKGNPLCDSYFIWEYRAKATS